MDQVVVKVITLTGVDGGAVYDGGCVCMYVWLYSSFNVGFNF